MATKFPNIPVDGFTDRDSFENWLEALDTTQRRASGPVLAARAAQRASVFVVAEKGKKHFKSLTLTVFRCNSIARIAGTRKEFFAAHAAAAYAAARAAYAAARAAYAAARAAYAAARAAYAADAFGGSSEDFWLALTRDARMLLDGVEPAALKDKPLWPQGVPAWWGKVFETLKAALQEDDAEASVAGEEASGWRVWTDWLQARVDGAPSWGLSAETALGLEERIALDNGRKDFWERAPEVVNGDVAGWLREKGWGAPSAAITSSEPENADNKALSPHIQTELELLNDSVDGSKDFLNRSEIAYVLAGRLNEVWDQMNPEPPKRQSPFDSAWWTGLFHERTTTLAPGYVMHLDAPWGGGKSTFAEYLIQILNPYRIAGDLPHWLNKLGIDNEGSWAKDYRRPWHIVHFNAWQHQHISPPWWVFYETIREACSKAVREEVNMREETFPLPVEAYGYRSWAMQKIKAFELWICEYWWRIMTTTIVSNVVFVVVVVSLLSLLSWFGFFFDLEKGPTTGGTRGNSMAGGLGLVPTLFITLFGGGAAVWKIVSAFSNSLLRGTPDAAQNFSMGSGDPLISMRKHFAAMTTRF